MKAIRVRIDSINVAHIRVTIFSGDYGFTLHNNGELVFGHDEYFAFISCLNAGTNAKVDLEGHEKIEMFYEGLKNK